MDQIMEPSSFLNKIQEMNETIDLLLEEFKKSCILSKMHPDNQEYQQHYEGIKTGLNQVQSKIASMSVDIQKNVDKINQSMLLLNVEIQQEKEINKELKRKLGIIENQSNAASEMINDYTQIYDDRYLRNWALGLSTLLCIATIGSQFRQ